jgi:hypothetical protein
MKQLLKRLFLSCHIHVHHYGSFAKLHQHLMHYDEKVREHEINKIAIQLKQANYHKQYNLFLKSFFKDFTLPITSAQFYGNGFSTSSLKSFRKVVSGKETYFEKIYFNSYPDIERLLFFDQNILPFLTNTFKIPEIKQKFTGDYITGVYFPFILLKTLSKENFEAKFIGVTSKLLEVSLENESILKSIHYPEVLLNFEEHFIFSKNKKAIIAQFSAEQYNDIIQKVAASRRIITHGDVFERNVFADNTVLDWDTFGLYPIGFDVAFIYYRLLHLGLIDETNPLNWLTTNYSTLITEEDWITFKFNFNFFLYVFSFSLKLIQQKEILQQQLHTELSL